MWRSRFHIWKQNREHMQSCEMFVFTCEQHISECGSKLPRTCETHMWKCAQMCNSHVKTHISRYGNRTEKTQNHVKHMSSHVNCTFLQIFTCGYKVPHMKTWKYWCTCETVCKCAVHMCVNISTCSFDTHISRYGNKTEKTWNHVKCMCFCKFSHVKINSKCDNSTWTETTGVSLAAAVWENPS